MTRPRSTRATTGAASAGAGSTGAASTAAVAGGPVASDPAADVATAGRVTADVATAGRVTAEPVTADVVAAALEQVPVVRLHAATPVATHLPGRRVAGVRMHDRQVEVHVAVVYPTTVAEAAASVRAALAHLDLTSVDVVVDDVLHPEDVEKGGGQPQPGQHTGGSP